MAGEIQKLDGLNEMGTFEWEKSRSDWVRSVFSCDGLNSPPPEEGALKLESA